MPPRPNPKGKRRQKKTKVNKADRPPSTNSAERSSETSSTTEERPKKAPVRHSGLKVPPHPPPPQSQDGTQPDAAQSPPPSAPSLRAVGRLQREVAEQQLLALQATRESTALPQESSAAPVHPQANLLDRARKWLRYKTVLKMVTNVGDIPIAAKNAVLGYFQTNGFVVICSACGQCLTPNQAQTLSRHSCVKKGHVEVTSNAVSQFDETLAEAFAFSGVSILQLERVLYCFRKHLSPTPLAQPIQLPARLNRSLWASVKSHNQRVRDFLKDQIRELPFVSVSIDGGTSLTLQDHLVAVTVHLGSATYALYVGVNDGQGVNASQAKEHFDKAVSSIGLTYDKVKFVCVDGAAVNRKMIRIMEEESPYLQDNNFRTYVQAELRHTKELHCRGHWCTTIIKHTQNTDFVKQNFANAIKFVHLFANMFANAPTRKRRFRSFLESFLQTSPTADFADVIQEQLELLTTCEITVGDVKENLASYNLQDVKDATKHDQMIHLLEQLAKKARCNKPVRTATAPKLRNDTRWLSSQYLSFEFALQHLPEIGLFASEESQKKGAPHSVTDMVKLCQDVRVIEHELSLYVELFKPAAAYLSKFSDHGSKPVAHLVCGETRRMRTEFERMASDTANELRATFGRTFLEEMDKYRPGEDRNEGLFQFVQMLDPRQARNLSTLTNTAYDQFRQETGIANSEFPKEEWVAYCAHIRKEKPCQQCPVQWWKDHCAKFPALSLLARAFLHLPVVVTSVDSLFSVEKWLLPAERCNIERANAVEQLLAHANGDVFRHHPRFGTFFGDSNPHDEAGDDVGDSATTTAAATS